jgi:hypothetical protein
MQRSPCVWRLLPVAALFLAGCAGFDDYAEQRALDATDVVRAHVLIGTGIDVKVECTRFCACGGGVYSAEAWGLANRHVGAWHETVTDFGLFLPQAVMANVHQESDLQGISRVSGSYAFEADNSGRGGGISDDSFKSGVPGTPLSHGLDWLTLRVTAFCFVGFDCELRVGEMLDFFGGVVGCDISQDDVPTPAPDREHDPTL